jgi:DNA-binding response OmpR family regulator
MDVMMPGGDGREAYRALRSQSDLPAVPVVMMSAAVHPHGLDPTIAAFLPKPFALDQLLATVNGLVGHPTTADQG